MYAYSVLIRSAIIHAKFCKISLVTQNGNNNILQHRTSLCWIFGMALGLDIYFLSSNRNNPTGWTWLLGGWHSMDNAIQQQIIKCLPNIATAHEEGWPFDDPPLPHCAWGVPRTGSSQVSTLKPCSCIDDKLGPFGALSGGSQAACEILTLTR